MINLNGIKAKNRIWLAAGAGGYGEGWPHEKPFVRLGLVDFPAFGAVVTKTLTLDQRKGNYIDPFEFWRKSFFWHCRHIFSQERKKVFKKVPGGWLNNLGWWNVGIDYWIENIYPRLQRVNIIPSIGGFVIGHYTGSIQKLNSLKIAGIELDISCPNVEHSFAQNPSELVKLFTFCRESSGHPLIVKLGVDCDYLRIAEIAGYCGLNAVSAINSVPALSGGYSGPAIKPIALKAVAELKKKTRLSVIGGGGIASEKDCEEFFETGADAVVLGSGFLLRPWEPTRIAKKYAKDPM